MCKRVPVTVGVLCATYGAMSLAAEINGYPAPAGSYSGGVKGSYVVTVHQASPASDRVDGEASFSYQFKLPVLPPPTKAECDPASPLVKVGECNHKCVKKDDYLRFESAPFTGIPVIWASPSCDAPVQGSVTPPHKGTARTSCVRQRAWGGTVKSAVAFKVGPLYQFNQPRTTKTGNTWNYENKANVVWPFIRVSVPVTIRCIAERQSPGSIEERRPPLASPTLLEFEAESLLVAGTAQVRGGSIAAQSMREFGDGWSGGQQVLLRSGGTGAALDLIFEVPAGAMYAIELYLTRAPDYGQLRFEIDGRETDMTFDGAAPKVMPAGPYQLGRFALPPGSHRLTIKVAGKHEQSRGYLAGIDKLRLYPAGPIN